MGSIKDFLKEHSDLKGDISPSSSKFEESVDIFAIVISISDHQTLFGHMGRKFIVSNNDIISIDLSDDPVPNIFGEGKGCRISLKPEANLASINQLLASDLVRPAPFPVQRPSQIPASSIRGDELTPLELQWFETRNIPIGASIQTTTYTGTQSRASTCTTSTRTGTGTMVDDSNTDDNPNDDYVRDDANPDDMTPSTFSDYL